MYNNQQLNIIRDKARQVNVTKLFKITPSLTSLCVHAEHIKCKAEVYAILSAACNEEVRQGVERKVYICSDIQAALKAISGPRARTPLAQECAERLEELARLKEVTLMWVPGHAGVPGNEEADRLARLGTREQFIGPEPAIGLRKDELRRSDSFISPSDSALFTDGSKSELGTGAGIAGTNPRPEISVNIVRYTTIFQAEMIAIDLGVSVALKRDKSLDIRMLLVKHFGEHRFNRDDVAFYNDLLENDAAEPTDVELEPKHEFSEQREDESRDPRI
nr:unnamed protein product [Callosobruchus analis]